MSWNFWYVGLILTSTLVDFCAAIKIDTTYDAREKKKWLLLSIFVNLGILFIFKYFNFFADSLHQLLNAVGLSFNTMMLDVLLPVGISFYTFQTISYTVDVYRGELRAERHFGYFALFVSFFPQLVAGPIERASHLLPQFRKGTRLVLSDIHIGINRILYGLFKKVVIADRLSVYVDSVFSSVHDSSSVVIFCAAFFFLIQVYCDFSGYSDVAVGVARLLGYDLIINFRRPFLSTSFNEYWQRWHISLSRWVRDYIYIPLGGNRVSIKRWYFNIIFSFILMGLWHGASWTFIVWGVMHGFLIALERLLSPVLNKLFPKSLMKIGGWLIVMFSFTLSMIFFRAENSADAFEAVSILGQLDFSTSLVEIRNGMNIREFILLIALIMILAFSYLLPQNFNFRYNYIFGVITIMLIVLFGVYETTQFVYFQF